MLQPFASLGLAIGPATGLHYRQPGEVLEAFLYVNQDGNQGQFASFQPICDDTPHTFTVRAQANGFRYHVGQAQVSAYVLLSSGASTSPGQTVTLHRGQG